MVCPMKLSMTGETPCELTTQAECRLAISILDELPTDRYAHGKNNLFFYGTPTDYYTASRLDLHGDLLNMTLQSALTNPAVQGARGRRENTLDDFPPYGCTRGEFDVLVSSTLLVATQSLVVEREPATTRAIENARLLGYLLLQSGANEHYPASHTHLFHHRSVNPKHGYRESAVIAAQRLMRNTTDELLHAGPPAPLQPPEGYVSPVTTAVQNYRAENPLLEQFVTDPTQPK